MRTVFQLVLAGIILYLLIVLIRGGRRGKATTRGGSRQPEEMKRDPVCGTFIPQSQALQLVEKNHTYYFCSRECLEKYRNGKPKE